MSEQQSANVFVCQCLWIPLPHVYLRSKRYGPMARNFCLAWLWLWLIVVSTSIDYLLTPFSASMMKMHTTWFYDSWWSQICQILFYFPALAGNCSFLRVTYSIGLWHGSWNCVASAGTIAKTVWISTICKLPAVATKAPGPTVQYWELTSNLNQWVKASQRITLLDFQCDMGLGSTLGCTLSPTFAPKLPPRNGSERFWTIMGVFTHGV